MFIGVPRAIKPKSGGRRAKRMRADLFAVNSRNGIPLIPNRHSVWGEVPRVAFPRTLGLTDPVLWQTSSQKTAAEKPRGHPNRACAATEVIASPR